MSTPSGTQSGSIADPSPPTARPSPRLAYPFHTSAAHRRQNAVRCDCAVWRPDEHLDRADLGAVRAKPDTPDRKPDLTVQLHLAGAVDLLDAQPQCPSA